MQGRRKFSEHHSLKSTHIQQLLPRLLSASRLSVIVAMPAGQRAQKNELEEAFLFELVRGAIIRFLFAQPVSGSPEPLEEISAIGLKKWCASHQAPGSMGSSCPSPFQQHSQRSLGSVDSRRP